MNKPIALTPPMGWNSWNTFTWDINEKMICEMADRMVEDGYLEAGYEYLVIDDCWSLKKRDADGNLVPDSACIPVQEPIPVPVIRAVLNMNSRMRRNLQSGAWII